MDEWIFRDLFRAITDRDEKRPFENGLLKYRHNAQAQFASLKHLGTSEAIDLQRQNISEDLYELYAFSRVNDVLLIALQNGNTFPTVKGMLNIDQYVDYMTALGLTLTDHKTFHPFFHEIMEVDQSDDSDEPISLVEIRYPCFMFDKLLISRAGVKVKGGVNYIKKEVAENSTLYFTRWRENRPTYDLSIGWGSNSQWGTEFRRDYATNDYFYYNVEGKENVLLPSQHRGSKNPAREDLTPEQRVELLVNRCFIKVDLPHIDLFPYDDRHFEARYESNH